MFSKRLFAAGLAAAAMTVVFGGCFGFYGLKFSKTNLKPGPAKQSKTVAKIWSQPQLSQTQKTRSDFPPGEYVFFLVDMEGQVKPLPGGARFDVPGKFGPKGGRRLVRDDAVRDALADGPPIFCGQGFDDSPEDFAVFRTQNRVRDEGKVKVKTFSTFPFRQLELAYPYGPPGANIQIGSWMDVNNDGAPQFDQDWIGCSGGGYFNLNLKDEPGATPTREQAAAARR